MQSIIFYILIICCNVVYASNFRHNNPVYYGIGAGYGSTTWAQLVPGVENQSYAMRLSAPIEVTEGGGVYNGFIGFEFSPSFALEVNYIHFPSVEIVFDSTSLYSFLNDGKTSLYTHTETVNLIGKFMVELPNDRLRAFSAIGLAGLHRRDVIINDWVLNPTFSAGINYHFDNHIMLELHGNFTTGYGESQLNPTDVYFPFLYAAMVRFAYFI